MAQVGETEVKTWQIRVGTKAPQAAGAIHSDFEVKGNELICRGNWVTSLRGGGVNWKISGIRKIAASYPVSLAQDRNVAILNTTEHTKEVVHAYL